MQHDSLETAKMPRDPNLPPKLYLFEHNMLSRKTSGGQPRPEYEPGPRRLSYAEWIKESQKMERRSNQLGYGITSKSTIMVKIVSVELMSSTPDQDSTRRTPSIRRRKAQTDLRKSMYLWSKPLPLLPFGIGEGPSFWSEDSGEEQADDRELQAKCTLNELVIHMGGMIKRTRDSCARRKRNFRLCMAWEVEEII